MNETNIDINLYDLVEQYIAIFSGNTYIDKKDNYIKAIISRSYRGYLSASTFATYNKKILPDKKKGLIPLNYILEILDYKYCGNCKKVKDTCYIRKNKANSTGFQSYCKVCHYNTTKITQAKRQSKRRLIVILQQSLWTLETELAQFYKNCPTGYHVDHIIPLNSPIVCGLHCIDNLQYLTAYDNESKSNKFEI